MLGTSQTVLVADTIHATRFISLSTEGLAHMVFHNPSPPHTQKKSIGYKTSDLGGQTIGAPLLIHPAPNVVVSIEWGIENLVTLS